MKLFCLTAKMQVFNYSKWVSNSITEYGSQAEMLDRQSELEMEPDPKVSYSGFHIQEATEEELAAFIQNKEHQILKALGDIEKHLSSAENLKAVVENLKKNIADYSAPEEKSEASLLARVEELEKENARLRSLCEPKTGAQKMSEAFNALSARENKQS